MNDPGTAFDLMEDAFRPIARDGAALVEVQIGLQHALTSLDSLAPECFGEAARALASEARERANAAFTADADRQRLAAVLQALRGAG